MREIQISRLVWFFLDFELSFCETRSTFYKRPQICFYTELKATQGPVLWTERDTAT